MWAVAVRQEGLLWKTVTGGGQGCNGSYGEYAAVGRINVLENITILRPRFCCVHGCKKSRLGKTHFVVNIS